MDPIWLNSYSPRAMRRMASSVALPLSTLAVLIISIRTRTSTMSDCFSIMEILLTQRTSSSSSIDSSQMKSIAGNHTVLPTQSLRRGEALCPWVTVNYREGYRIFTCNGILFIATGEGHLGTGVFGGSVLIRRTRLATARED